MLGVIIQFAAKVNFSGCPFGANANVGMDRPFFKIVTTDI